jgi:hypothetical protein
MVPEAEWAAGKRPDPLTIAGAGRIPPPPNPVKFPHPKSNHLNNSGKRGLSP